MILELADLPIRHPALVWDAIVLATVAMLNPSGESDRISFRFEIDNVPQFGSETTDVELSFPQLARSRISQFRRTYEPHRLVEFAAIGIAGVVLAYAGGHEIRDMALRGTAADYLVDAEGYLLEIAGRTRRVDCDSA